MNGLCCDSLSTNHFASAWKSVPHGTLIRFVLVVVLKSLDEQRGRLFYRVEQPAVTGPNCERPDLAAVASSDPLEIAKSVRQVGDAGILHCGADLDRILRLALLHCVHRREGQHDSQVRKQVRSVGAQSRMVRAQRGGGKCRSLVHATSQCTARAVHAPLR